VDQPRVVTSIDDFLAAIERDYSAWKTAAFPWFRGEPDPESSETPVFPLVPKVFRPKQGGGQHDENALLQFFRLRAPVLGLPILPDTDRTDQWLFVARHVGLPTRLLDWTEGALIALYFAVREGSSSVVWMLNPHALNLKNVQNGSGPVPNEPTLTWVRGGESANLYNLNVRAAWELGVGGTELPVAIHPTNIHPLMSAQHSCFTIHGRRREGLCAIVQEDCLIQYKIRLADQAQALHRLRRLGISESTLFPDPLGLARELEFLF
jgi:hypothetical protein